MLISFRCVEPVLFAPSLAALGAAVIDAEAIAREVVLPGTPALARVVERFGAGVLDAAGAIDRPALGRLVLGDERARADLEAIIHPAVAERTQEALAVLAARGARLEVDDVPLLYETGLDKAFPEVVVGEGPASHARARQRADARRD